MESLTNLVILSISYIFQPHGLSECGSNFSEKGFEMSPKFRVLLLACAWVLAAPSGAQQVFGDNLAVTGDGSSSNVVLQTDGQFTSGLVGNLDHVYISTQKGAMGTVVSNAYVGTLPDGVEIGSDAKVTIFRGPIDGTTGSVTTPNGIYMDSSYTAMFSQGGSQTTVTGWVSSYANTSSLSQVNGMLANSSGVVIQSATALTLSGATISLTGATQINTTGTANTSVGNSTGTVTVVGSAVSIGSNSGSSLSLGSSSANSTVSLNGNRLQNVGNAVAGTDAVNLNQVNSLIGSTTTQLASMQQQLSASERGIAGVSAMANLPAPDKGQQYSVGVGLGSFRSQTALALGVSMKFHERWVGKVSASVSSGSYVTGAGLSYGF